MVLIPDQNIRSPDVRVIDGLDYNAAVRGDFQSGSRKNGNTDMMTSQIISIRHMGNFTADGWCFARNGKPVKNRELWEELLKLTEIHLTTVTDSTGNTYKNCMQADIKKIMENGGKK